MLVLEKSKVKIVKSATKKIYINTLIPNFNYRSKSGSLIYTNNCCVNL
ncbi:hypothetical protein BX611_1206 [Lutibacter oceani]|uniref:Uncharacterized protein n=1 Tax=Lutibacter oceani TaxID=1853311 RepID=A0A3D9RV98_9FLAO|nr:hypothetical protein BX611_1206 [Lutibacter oceani]